MNDIIPKSHNKFYDEIIFNFKNDISSIVKLHDNNLSPDLVSSIIENKYNSFANNIQTYINNYISQSENRINTNLDNIKDLSCKNNIIQEKINNDISTYFNKYKVSSVKGLHSENKLYDILMHGFPSDEIINTSNITSSGDFFIKRFNKPTILVENKDYSVSVKKDEVDKFIRDVTKNKCHGIFLSQNSGIVNKQPFQIDIHDNHILIYIHYVDYDINKIKLAINTIDILFTNLNNLQNELTNIPTSVLKNINIDYNQFLLNRDKLVANLKDYFKKTMETYNDIDLPQLNILLSNHFANNKKNLILCDICKTFNGKNLKSIARHKKACKIKYINIIDNSLTDTDSLDNTSNVI